MPSSTLIADYTVLTSARPSNIHLFVP